MNAPTCGSVFSGAGLLDFGLHLAGFEHAWLCESVPFRRELLAKRFPDAVVHDDIRTLRGPFAADSERDAVWQQPVAKRGGSSAAVTGRSGEATADANVARADAYPETSRSRGAASERDLVVPRVLLVAGGFPCKGGSTAGKQNGFEHAETVLWFEMRRVIREVRPRYVLIENVAALLSVAASPGEPSGSLWGTVLGDLVALGTCDIRWDCVPAAAVGSPHLRDRLFAVASFATGEDEWRGSDDRGQEDGRPDASGSSDWLTADSDEAGRIERGGRLARGAQLTATQRLRADAANTDECKLRAGRNGGRANGVQADLGSPAAPTDASGNRWRDEGRRRSMEPDQRPARADIEGRGVAVEWGDYQPAITSWEAVHGPAPEPLIRRMDARSAARVDRSRLSALGDGVCVHVGYLAGEYIMSRERDRLAAAA